MKKVLILSVFFLLSACGCMNSNESQPEVVYTAPQTVQYSQNVSNCDFFENGVCYHYVYDTTYAPVTYREYRRNNYSTGSREVRNYRQPSCNAREVVTADGGCKSTVRETREPVEVVYKKTKYTTVYEPKTYEDVSYEKEPYNRREGCQDCL